MSGPSLVAIGAPITLPELEGPHTLSGEVVVTNEGKPVPGATVHLTQGGEASVVTDANGRFSIPHVPGGFVTAMISAPGFVTRRRFFEISRSRDDLLLDIISQAPPFNLPFYRDFARNGQSGTFQPLIDPIVVEGIKRIVMASVPELSANRLQVERFETGIDARPQENGLVRIVFLETTPFGDKAIGQSTVGGPFGTVTLRYNLYTQQAIGPCGVKVVEVMEHEIVHTMGFFHTDNVAQDFNTPDCSGVNRSERARFHVAIAYSRQVGNSDIDADQVATPFGSAAVQARSISCTLSEIQRSR